MPQQHVCFIDTTWTSLCGGCVNVMNSSISEFIILKHSTYVNVLAYFDLFASICIRKKDVRHTFNKCKYLRTSMLRSEIKILLNTWWCSFRLTAEVNSEDILVEINCEAITGKQISEWFLLCQKSCFVSYYSLCNTVSKPQIELCFPLCQ